MQDEKLQELFKRIDAQILETREKKASYGQDRRRQQGNLPAGQEERRKGQDRRNRVRGKEKE